ncbi:MAG: 4-(cytidine 5'-diphospho)-2-C-methyl-D-erythritol kinase, partial [Desulfotomaculales bacterium]
NAGLTEGELLALGERLGADVPFCLLGGTALARGKGEVLTPLPSLKGLGVVLVKPPFGVSTAAAYHLYDRLGGGPRPANRQMLAALEKKDLPAVGRLLGNVFEGPVFSLYPELREVKEALLRAGVLGASLSGSGPAVFGLCRDIEQAARVAGRLRLPREYTVLVTETV